MLKPAGCESIRLTLEWAQWGREWAQVSMQWGRTYTLNISLPCVSNFFNLFNLARLHVSNFAARQRGRTYTLNISLPCVSNFFNLFNLARLHVSNFFDACLIALISDFSLLNRLRNLLMAKLTAISVLAPAASQSSRKPRAVT